MSNAPGPAAPSRTHEAPSDSQHATNRLRTALLLSMVVAAACLPMLPSLGYELVWDDRTAIGPILDTHGIRDWLAVWTSPFDTVLRPGETGGGYYRPVIVTTLLLDRALYGDWLPGYHITNIAWYAATCVFLWLFLREWSGNPWTSTLGALLYAVHPVHAESVCLITGRVDLVVGPPYFAALWLAARGPRPRAGATLAETGWHWTPALVLLIAMFAKEVALLGAPVIALVSWLRARDRGLPGLLRAALPVALAGVFALVVRFSIPGLDLGRERGAAAASVGAEILTGFGALGDYVQWMLSGTGLAARHEMPAYAGFDVATGVGIAAFLTVIGALYWTLSPRPDSRVAAHSRWSVAPALVATTLLPLCWSPLLSSIGVAERLLYLPSAALAVGVAMLPLRAAAGVAGLGIVVFGAALPARVAVWSDQTTLFESMLRDSGETAYLHNVLGVEYRRQGDAANSLRHFASAHELAPADPMPLEAMVDVLVEQQRFDEALARNERWLALRPEAARGWFLRGAIQLARGDANASVAAYERALSLAPQHASIHFGLATALAERGEFREALDRVSEAQRLEPGLAGLSEFRAHVERALEEQGRD